MTTEEVLEWYDNERLLDGPFTADDRLHEGVVGEKLVELLHLEQLHAKCKKLLEELGPRKYHVRGFPQCPHCDAYTNPVYNRHLVITCWSCGKEF